MTDALQYGAMGLLALVLGAVYQIARASFARRDAQTETLVQDVLKTNGALRESMARMGERFVALVGRVEAVGEGVDGLRRDFGRAGIRLSPLPPEPDAPIAVEARGRPRTDPTGRRKL